MVGVVVYIVVRVKMKCDNDIKMMRSGFVGWGIVLGGVFNFYSFVNLGEVFYCGNEDLSLERLSYLFEII